MGRCLTYDIDEYLLRCVCHHRSYGGDGKELLMWLGVDYYPEQWDISMIDEDMDNIVELGCNVIRIAGFM